MSSNPVCRVTPLALKKGDCIRKGCGSSRCCYCRFFGCSCGFRLAVGGRGGSRDDGSSGNSISGSIISLCLGGGNLSIVCLRMIVEVIQYVFEVVGHHRYC